MCGRYHFGIDNMELKEIADAVQMDSYENFKGGEIFPADTAPILVEKKGKISPVLAKWGFPKYTGKGVIINARIEGLTEKRMFKSLVNSNRCIIPSSGFFEWKRNSAGAKLKDKYFFKRPDSILYMAGLYNKSRGGSGQISLFDTDAEQISYVVITRSANSYMAGIHDRMPLIFTKTEMESWLRGEDVNTLLAGNHAELIHSVASRA